MAKLGPAAAAASDSSSLSHGKDAHTGHAAPVDEPPLTLLEKFLKRHRIKPAQLARMTGYTRQHLLRIRMGRQDPTRRCMAAIIAACRKLSWVEVRAADLFLLDKD